MKSYEDQVPVIVIGGTAEDFLGEYMAGGILILLGLNKNHSIAGNYLGTGMHGGIMYIRGKVDNYQLGKEVDVGKITEEDENILKMHLDEYCKDFGLNLDDMLEEEFIKLTPHSHRPYGKLYCH